MVFRTRRVEQHVKTFLKRNHLEGGDDRTAVWTVALSGGIDSMVMLYLLNQLSKDCNARVEAVHVNHGLRETAVRDEHFAAKMCMAWDIPLTVKTVCLSAIPEPLRRGTEADARKLRYQAIAEAVPKDVSQQDTPVVFLAHHADDQVETVLLRVARGTSLTGLSGMRPIREWQGIRFVRPLLGLTKNVLIAYAEEHSVPHVEDETNQSIEYTRNYLRNVVIPALRNIQPNLSEVMARAAGIWQLEDELLEQYSNTELKKCAHAVENGWVMDASRLLEEPLPLQRRIVKIILYSLASVDWTFDHVESILKLCDHKDPSGEVHLPSGVHVRRVYDEVHILSGSQGSALFYSRGWELEAASDFELKLEGTSFHWTFSAVSHSLSSVGRPMSRYETLFPKDFELSIRPAELGERMNPLGMQGSKKVQDLFVDRKIPRHLRRSWPCFYFGNELVWIPGVARSARYVLSGEEPGWFVTSRMFTTS